MRANMYYMRAIMNRNPRAVHILRRLIGKMDTKKINVASYDFVVIYVDNIS